MVVVVGVKDADFLLIFMRPLFAASLRHYGRIGTTACFGANTQLPADRLM